MAKSKINIRFSVLTLMVLLAALSRLIPHPSNVAPIGAMALFGAAYFNKKHIAFIIPVASMWISDLIINNVVYGDYFDHFVWFYHGFYWTYGAFILIGLTGFILLKKVSVKTVLFSSLSASVLFFLVSNFGVWASGTLYPHTFQGLITCYTAGLPFLKNTFLGDLIYSGVMFGAFEFAQHKISVIQPKTIGHEKNMSGM